MNKNFVSSLYVINIIAQCIFSLIMPMLLMLAVSWLLVSRAGLPSWIYAVLVPIGTLGGIVSMIKFAISASESLTRLERQRENKDSKK